VVLVSSDIGRNKPYKKVRNGTDVLNGRLFFEILKTFSEQYPDFLGFLDEVTDDISQECSKIALDLKGSQWQLIEQFFNAENNKFLFSQRYSENIGEDYDIPSWIKEIRVWLE